MRSSGVIGGGVDEGLPELLADVLAGKLYPSPVLGLTVDLAGVPEGTQRWTGSVPSRSWSGCEPSHGTQGRAEQRSGT